MYNRGYVGATQGLPIIRAGLEAVIPPLDYAVAGFSDLVLQAGSAVEGDMQAAEMTLEGAITGNLNCGGNLTLGAKSVVTGDISTKDITTTLGAHINGRVEMKKA